jgi:F420-dependent oxidoreductase-like protein
MTRLGYQIPNFNYPGVTPAGLFDAVAAQAKAAERSGFDTVLLMDHFYQLPMLGPPDNYMLECYTTLAALARETSRVRLSALVTGNTYRNPAMLAKVVTALDVVSNGRAQLGIGAGWFELEHNSMGYEFGTFTDRFEKLEEALQIILPMLRGERPSLDGKHYRVSEVINEPPPVGRIPIMIGGSGEKKTLRMVAQYADESNLTYPADQLPRKLEALAAHCERLGRDRAEITLSQHLNVVIAEDHDAAYKAVVEFLRSRGVDVESMDEDSRAGVLNIVVWGGEDEVGEKLAAILELGAEGFTCSLPGHGHDTDRVEQLGRTASKVLGL